ncbi:MAG: threonine-phosphate decarboxylase CobD [Pseudomonadota bacterium]
MPLAHGGRIDEAMARYGGSRARWIDLSTGINPSSYPIPDIPTHIWHDLPDAGTVEAARRAVRLSCGAAENAPVSLAPGSQLHIELLPRQIKQQAVAIAGFTYQEHAHCWSKAGHEVYVTDGLESAETTARVVVVVNPNNPDGQTHRAADLLALAQRLAIKGGLLVVDEAFGDVAPELSLGPEAGRLGLCVMRSLGKFYGLGGIRFGALLGPQAIVDAVDDAMGPWAVSGPAMLVAESAFRDRTWQKRNRKKLAQRRAELEALLGAHGLDVIGGTDLFVLARHEQAPRLAQVCAQHHILIRTFTDRPDWLRFGIPAGKSVLNRLAEALAECAPHHSGQTPV